MGGSIFRNENVEMANNYQDKLNEIGDLKAEVERLSKVEDEIKILRLVFSL